jgi:hypothetical protein
VRGETKFVNWYSERTPLGKKLATFLQAQNELKDKKEKSSKNKKKLYFNM